MSLNHKCALICILFLLCPTLSQALPTDTQQTIHIVADSSLFDYKTGVNTYEGNVKVDQGSTHLLADRVTTKNDANHKVEEAVAYGNKKNAEYSTIPKEGDLVFKARSKVIKFYPQKSKVILEGNVVVTQGENSFNGPIIIYNMKDQTVDAPASKSGRSTIVIEPNKIQS